VKEATKQACEHCKNTKNIKGFRKGIVPDNVIKQHYKREIERHGIETLIGMARKELKTKIKNDMLVESPSYEISEYKNDIAVLNVKYEVYPNIEFKKIDDIQFDEYEWDENAKDIEKAIQTFIANNVILWDKSKNDKVLKEDRVIGQIAIYTNEKSKTLLMEREIVIDTSINHKTFGFENDLVGKKKGDIIKNKTKAIPAILGYFDSVKEYNIEFKIENILSGKILKADDNQVLKKAGSKTKKEMEEKIKKSINNQFNAANSQIQSNILLDEICKIYSGIEIPKSLFEREMTTIEQATKNSDKKVKEKIANQRAILATVFSKYSTENKIEATANDYQLKLVDRAQYIASHSGEAIDKVYKTLRDNFKNYRHQFTMEIVEEKATKKMIEKAKKAKKKISKEQLLQIQAKSEYIDTNNL